MNVSIVEAVYEGMLRRAFFRRVTRAHHDTLAPAARQVVYSSSAAASPAATATATSAPTPTTSAASIQVRELAHCAAVLSGCEGVSESGSDVTVTCES